jgi:hypothetical protein
VKTSIDGVLNLIVIIACGAFLASPAFSVASRSTREACTAGRTPKTTPTATEDIRVTRSTRQSIVALDRSWTIRGMFAASIASNARIPIRPQETEHAARPGKDQALGQELTRDPSTARACGRSDGHFSLPNGRPDEEQVGSIGADHQEDELDRTKEQQQGWPHVSDQGAASSVTRGQQ